MNDGSSLSLTKEKKITLSDQARFFKSKGPVFRELWGKRLARGLTSRQALQLKGLIDAFVEKENDAN